ncbi:MAG: GAF domain-containing protein, partial [Pedobacter sp.]
NVLFYFDLEPNTILGKHISVFQVFDTSADAGLESILRFHDSNGSNTTRSYQRSRLDLIYNVSVDHSGDFQIIEIEPVTSVLSADTHSAIGRSLSEILSDKTLDTVLNNAAFQLRELIQYDRVMIYKFHSDGHGEVVAEKRSENLESWVGLHYPASDIPKQARELYKNNLVRLIADVNSIPSALLSLNKSLPLDLTNCSLRAVSPIHIQYLKNMQVASSFSVSIVENGALWGLIACHNYSPKIVDYSQRESAKLIGQVLGSAIGFREREEIQTKTNSHAQALDSITRNLLRNAPIEETVVSGEIKMDDIIDCGGAALYFEGKIHATGNVPPNSFITKLIPWLDHMAADEMCYSTSKLSNEFPDALEFSVSASGLMACRLGKNLSEYLLWFRPEVISNIRWAGNPNKPTHIDEHGLTHISPRNSFVEWSEQVQHSSSNWQEYEKGIANQLRDEVNYAINRKALELRAINEKLRLAYAELDTFSYTIAHDLKNPLTTIKSFAQLLANGNATGEKAITMAKRIEQGANKMKEMIDEVLSYSKVGQSSIERKAINMYQMISEIRSDLLVSYQNPDLKIIVGDTPDLYGDQIMLLQVFSNIISNAVKYSSKSAAPLIQISGQIKPDKIVYSISDNGIGIDKKDHNSIFDLFSRASSSNDYEGTGVGLSIAKRIVERHNGNISMFSESGKGSVFNISFPIKNLLLSEN